MSVRDTISHTVLATAESDAFGSLRKRPTSRRERFDVAGRCATGAAQVPRPLDAAGRPTDPVELIMESHVGRLDWLIPIRVGRMVSSPYGFLRGTAIVMADDVARLPATGITPVICGDAHLGNFGFYASPERELVIDLNDFDEAHPGGWEWDLRRLVASIWVAGRQNGSDRGAVPRRRCCPASPRTANEVAFPGRTATADARPTTGWTSSRLHETATEKIAAGGDRAVGQAGPDPDQ